MSKQRFTGQPWAIHPGNGQAFADQRTQTMGFDLPIGVAEPAPNQGADIFDGVAVVDVSGVVLKDPDAIDLYFGAADIGAISNILHEAEGRSDVDAVVLRMDTPGGTITGVPELADQIAGMGKPVVAFTDSLCASAGYWLAASADAFISTSSAIVGSIGVYTLLHDFSRAYEAQGVRAVLVKAGDLKGAGIPGTQITDEQIADIQRGIDFCYDQFTSHVSAHRPNVSADTMQGQTFHAGEALPLGLIDSIETGLSDAIDLARTLAG